MPFIEFSYLSHKLHFEYNEREKPTAIWPLQREIFEESCYQSENCFVERGDVVIDGGANIGLFTILAFMHGAKHVIAVEPNEKCAALLTENVRNHDNTPAYFLPPVMLEVHTKALWHEVRGEEQKMPFFCGRTFATSHIMGRLTDGDERWDTRVTTTTVDKIAEKVKIDLIKFDLEGSDYTALHGAINTIRRDRPKLVLSLYHHEEDQKNITRFIVEELKLGYGEPEIKGPTIRGRFYPIGLWKKP